MAITGQRAFTCPAHTVYSLAASGLTYSPVIMNADQSRTRLLPSTALDHPPLDRSRSKIIPSRLPVPHVVAPWDRESHFDEFLDFRRSVSWSVSSRCGAGPSHAPPRSLLIVDAGHSRWGSRTVRQCGRGSPVRRPTAVRQVHGCGCTGGNRQLPDGDLVRSVAFLGGYAAAGRARAQCFGLAVTLSGWRPSY